jgi:hypothetical protein
MGRELGERRVGNIMETEKGRREKGKGGKEGKRTRGGWGRLCPQGRG